MKLQILNMTEKTQYEARKAPSSTDHIDHDINPCQACLAPCCTKTVHMNGVEAALISRALSIPFSDFIVPDPFEPFEGQVGFDGIHPIELEDGPIRLRMRRREDFGCVFRLHVAGRGRCGIYANRPGVCRVYPYAWLDDDKHLFVGTTELCKVRWLYDDDAVVALERNVDRWREDSALDGRLAAAWNEAFAEKESAERTLDALGAFFVAGLDGDD